MMIVDTILSEEEYRMRRSAPALKAFVDEVQDRIALHPEENEIVYGTRTRIPPKSCQNIADQQHNITKLK